MVFINLKKYCIIGYFFSTVLGILLHFAFKWSGYNAIIGAFVPVNESIWEHLKLVFLPMVIYYFLASIVLEIKSITIPSLSNITAISALLAMVLTVIFYYTYVGILGSDVAFVNILIFLIAMAVGYYCQYSMLMKINPNDETSWFDYIPGYIVIVVILLLFIIWTFFPPQLNLFISPV